MSVCRVSMRGRGGSALLLATALLAMLVPAPVQASTSKAQVLAVRWQPVRVVNGSPVVFQVSTSEKLNSLAGKWLGHEVYFTFDSSRKGWYGIAGVSIATHPGKYSLQLTGMDAIGKEVSFRRSITVGKGKYHSIAVKVAKKYTEPNPEQLRQISEDKTLKERIFAPVEPERAWSGSFSPPVEAQISDVFGTTRTFNGQAQSTHLGLDYAVPPGTPVSALNSGTVRLAQSLFFEGNCVVIDHGQGLMTVYLHLSKLKVKEGDRVQRGQELGLSGGTGRATGPHLHIAVRWEGIYLNPATLLALKLP